MLLQREEYSVNDVNAEVHDKRVHGSLFILNEEQIGQDLGEKTQDDALLQNKPHKVKTSNGNLLVKSHKNILWDCSGTAWVTTQ